jgi:hypothetical protein
MTELIISLDAQTKIVAKYDEMSEVKAIRLQPQSCLMSSKTEGK